MNERPNLSITEQQEYISTLEESIEFLQKEIERLKQTEVNRNEVLKSDFPLDKMPEPLYYQLSSVKEIETSLFEYLSSEINCLEILLVTKDDDGSVIAFSEYSVSLGSTYLSLVENGLIKWLFTKRGPVVVPSLSDENTSKPTYLLLFPYDNFGNQVLFMAKTSLSKSEIDEAMLEKLANRVYCAVLLISWLNNDKKSGVATKVSDSSTLMTLKSSAYLLDLILKRNAESIISQVQLINKRVGAAEQRLNSINEGSVQVLEIIKFLNRKPSMKEALELLAFHFRNEGIDFELILGDDEVTLMERDSFIYIVCQIIGFCVDRYINPGSMKVFVDKVVQPTSLTIAAESSKLGTSFEVNNSNYKSFGLPSSLDSILDNISQAGYYFTVFDEPMSTYYKLSWKDENVDKIYLPS